MATSISVTPGYIGQKTNKDSLLTYSITTDGPMSTITEKVNGVTVGTKTATSGQSLIAGLTQAQWDAVRFGKYADATGGENTLTVEMGSEKWTYTFDKRPAANADILTAAKAVKDSQEVYLPKVKADLIAAVNKKGGSAVDGQSFEEAIAALNAAPEVKRASGTATSSTSTETFYTLNDTTSGTVALTVPFSSIGFVPKRIILTHKNANYLFKTIFEVNAENFYPKTAMLSIYDYDSYTSNNFSYKADRLPAYVNETGFKLPLPGQAGVTYRWEAFDF